MPEGTTAYFHALKGPTGPVATEPAASPTSFALAPPFPNPFTTATMLRLHLDEPGHLRVVIFDALGRRVRVLEDAAYAPTVLSLSWDGKDAAGVELPDGGHRVGDGGYHWVVEGPAGRRFSWDASFDATLNERVTWKVRPRIA